MRTPADILSRPPTVRYLFAIVVVIGTFALRLLLIPLTGTGAPFVLFFAAVLVISLYAGVGPGILAVFLSMPLATYMFVMRAGVPPIQASIQSALFIFDGFVVVYLTFLINRSRQTLQDVHQSAREVIELSPDAFFLADLDGRLTDVNQAACRMLGYERDELLGKTAFDLIPAEDTPRLRAVKEELLAPGGVSKAEWRHRRKDGTLIPVEVSSNILPDGRWQAFVRDISERKTFEDALRRAVSARDDVLSIVAHDLRNPLSTILLQCSLLNSQKPRDVISRAATRMNHLIQDLLDVATVDAGQLKIDRGRVSAADLVSEAVDMQTTLASAAGIEIRLDAARDLPQVWGGRERLLRVFQNLIGNAMKFTKPGGQITVGAAEREHDVMFWVADTGSGIEAESLAHVFDRFWRTTRTGRAGAGLGLTITKGIVEAHGGRIWVESKVGSGSTFYFAIPTTP